MSGFNPLAALAAQVVAGAEAAIEQATLDLGSVVQELRAQISVGDVIIATVLPPQDGSDRISLLGQTVTAQLPPGINPGEMIALQVTGFTNTAVLVSNLGPADPENPPQAVQLPPAAAPEAALDAQTAVLTTRLAQPSAPSPPTASAIPTAVSNTTPLAPSREIFVAASVQDSAASTSPQSPSARPTGGAALPADVEARLAVTRAGRLEPSPIPRPSAATNSVPAQPRQPPVVPPSGRLSIPPIITPAQPSASEAGAPDYALLVKLGVPVSAATLAAARSINTAAQMVSSSYQKLDTLLASVGQDDRTAALRNALSFVGRLDLRNARALPEQIASFVSNVVDGAESKIAQIVRAWRDGATPADAAPNASAPSNAPPAPPQLSAAVAARVAERIIALDRDVKSAILAMIEDPPSGSTPQVLGALREALTATNALQLNVLSSKTNDTSTVTIPLPAYFYEGGRPAQLQISRDAPNSKNRLDADNFHVAFILDTSSLGTVAIDMQAVGRSITIDVKTQATTFADRFRSTLGDLRTRLEQLHYRVASIGAGIAANPPAAGSKPEVVAEPPQHSNVDMRA